MLFFNTEHQGPILAIYMRAIQHRTAQQLGLWRQCVFSVLTTGKVRPAPLAIFLINHGRNVK